jgi:hypothetical protein
MVKNLRPLKDNMHNADWLNAVRNVSGPVYQARVPEATQANITDVINNLWLVPDLRNQFIDALINRIGMVLYQTLTWTNPLGKFKRGFLEYGETIEQIFFGLLEATSYDPNRDELEKEIFGAMTPEVQVNYHSVDRRDRYKLTVSEPELRKAFLTSGGVSTFMSGLMGMLQNSDQLDEYHIMANLFAEMDKAGGFFNENTADLSDLTVDNAAGSKVLLKKLRRYANVLQFYSRNYNPAGMPTHIQPNEMELFVTASADAEMDVDALAGAFNIGKMEFNSRKTVIPDEDFGIPGAQAILTTRDFFVCADQRIETTNAFNPATLKNNYWLHHWGVYSVSRFAPAILFSTRPTSVITVTTYTVTSIGTITVQSYAPDTGFTTVTKVQRGQTFNVQANAVTTPAGGPNDAVSYSVQPAGTAPAFALSQFTYMTNDGELFIGPDEQNESLVVTVRAVENPLISSSVTLPVWGDLIIPWPNPEVLTDTDADSLLEVTPKVPTFKSNVITIPTQAGVQFKNGATNVAQGSKITVVSGTPVTINASALTGYEIASGATVTWTFTFA